MAKYSKFSFEDQNRDTHAQFHHFYSVQYWKGSPEQLGKKITKGIQIVKEEVR